MDFNQIINTVKRRSESICEILFYIAAGLCFIFYVGSFNGSFMPVMGTLISMVIEVGLWLLIPVLLSIRRRSIAKWAFLGISIYWALTTIFSMLDGTGLATTGATALSSATGVFCFIIACAMIVATVFATVAYWKKDKKMKVTALLVFIGIILLFVVLFALRVALYAKWGMGWNVYFYLIYAYVLIPVAMCFAALAFWFDEGELRFAVFEKKTASVSSESAEESANLAVTENEEEALVAAKETPVVEGAEAQEDIVADELEEELTEDAIETEEKPDRE